MAKRSIFGKGYTRARALVVTNPNKFTPGMYNALPHSETYSSASWTAVKNEVFNTLPIYRGAMVRYMWPDLEDLVQGSYNFTDITNKLNDMHAQGKKLVILIHSRSFAISGTRFHVVPTYMRNATYENGEYQWTGSGQVGYNIAIYNANVQARYIALLQALAAAFESHPGFEGVGFTETSVGTTTPALTPTQDTARLNGIINVLTQAKAAFPTTMVFQFFNFTQSNIATLIPALIPVGIGLHCPDIMPDEAELTDSVGSVGAGNLGVYRYYSLYRTGTKNDVPFGAMIGSKNYFWTNLPHGDPAGHSPTTVNELYEYARDVLNVNYIWVTRNNSSAASINASLPPPDPNIQDCLAANAAYLSTLVAPAGGLNTTRPASID